MGGCFGMCLSSLFGDDGYSMMLCDGAASERRTYGECDSREFHICNASWSAL